MQLYILDKDPIKSAQLIPDKYKFKMLIELGQLICSAGISDVYKSIPQGKELQEWVKKHPTWTFWYFIGLYDWTLRNIKFKQNTLDNLEKIRTDLVNYSNTKSTKKITHTYFRYAKEYKCDIPSKTLLPIDQCITEYKKYLGWKIKR